VVAIDLLHDSIFKKIEITVWGGVKYEQGLGLGARDERGKQAQGAG
jgi:hypothetical protein